MVKANVQLTDSTQTVVFDKQIDAAQRMRGENTLVKESLGKTVSKELKQLPGLKAPDEQ